MARRKVKMTLIQDKTYQKACYKKRKNGLLKKVQELSILCGVEACVLIYNPYDGQPETWPPSYEDVMKVVSRFENLSELDQSRKMMNQEGLVKENIRKLQKQLKKVKNDNRQKEIRYLINQYMSGYRSNRFEPTDLHDLWRVANQKLKQINLRIEHIKEEGTAHPPPPPPPPPSTTMQTARTTAKTDLKKPMVEPGTSMQLRIQNLMSDNINARWPANQQPSFSDFIGDDDLFIATMLTNDGAGPSFSKF